MNTAGDIQEELQHGVEKKKDYILNPPAYWPTLLYQSGNQNSGSKGQTKF